MPRIPVLPCALLPLALALAAPAAEPGATPALTDLRAARAQLGRAASGRERAAALVAVAAAHTARARESGDGDHYTRALGALARAREADPAHEGLGRIEAWVRLGRHEFEEAAALARARVASHPEDHEAWGLLGDAWMELGRDDAAADAYRRMMDLRPGPGAYLRAACYRERAGDLEGALGLLRRTLAATPDRETEQRAWLLVQMASLDERLGHADRAGARLRRALSLFPDYHYALAALAEHHLGRGRAERAVAFARRALAAAPHAERRLVLADALRATGRGGAARAAEAAFEREALAHVDRADNENLFLVDYYLERRPDPERALAIARREAARRPTPAILEGLARARARAGASGSPAEPVPGEGASHAP